MSLLSLCRLGSALSFAALLAVPCGLRAEDTEAASPVPEAAVAYSLEALAPTLATPEAAFAFVRDQVAHEPYAGVMKGAEGTLLTRGGNAWDRALLLQRLLATQGVEAQLTVATLSEKESSRRLATVTTQPSATAQVLQTLPRPEPAAAGDPGAQEWLVDLQSRTTARAKELRALEAVPGAWIDPALQGLAPPAIEGPRELVWVRAIIDGNVVDLDPSLPTAQAGQAPMVDGEVASMAEPPEDSWHRLTVRLVAEHLTPAGELHRSDLLDRSFPAARLRAIGLRLALLPRIEGQAVGEFRWMLYSGDEEIESEPFRMQAKAGGGLDPGVAAGFGGLFGGDEEPEPAEPAPAGDSPRLARVYVDFTLSSPGLPPETFRRVVLDRIEPAANGWRLMPALAEDRRVRPLLVQVWDVGVDLGTPHPGAVWTGAIAAYQTVEPVALFLATGAPLEQSDVRAPGASALLEGFFLASGLRREGVAAANASPVRSFLVRPRLALVRRGTEIADWMNPGGKAPRYREGVDIVNTPYRFIGDQKGALKTARQAGIADTALEVHAFAQPARLNTLPVFAAAERQKLAVSVVATAAELEARALPLPVHDALLAEILAGRRVVLPEKPVAYAGSHVFAWWSVDPASGYVLGRAELGGGQAMTEYSKLDEQIAEWTKIVSKFYGSVMRCYLKSLANALVTVEVDVQNAKVDAQVNHGKPGESPMPDAAQLRTCVTDAACEAIADLLNSRINAAVAGLEIKVYYDILLKALKQAKIDSPEKAIEKGCQKKLGGGA